MSLFQVTQELILDAAEVADVVEANFGMYLLPPPSGLYMPHQTRPVMRAGQYYYQRIVDAAGLTTERVIQSQEDIRDEDVLDANHARVVPAKASKLLRVEPTLPVRGMLLLADIASWVIQSTAAWTHKKCPPLSDTIVQHLKEEYRDYVLADTAGTNSLSVRMVRDPEFAKRVEANTDVIQRLEDATSEVRSHVREFIGKNTWVMHFHKLRGRDLIVEATLDYRIYDWERRMSSGEWS